MDKKQKRTPWQRIRVIAKAVRKDIATFLVVYEFFSFVGLGIFVIATVNLALRNTPLQLNDAGLIALALSGIGVMVSFLYGYWEHLLKRDEEWER
jgi:hypothetical protein